MKYRRKDSTLTNTIKETNRNIARTALPGKGPREAGQTAVNAFRTFADMEVEAAKELPMVRTDKAR